MCIVVVSGVNSGKECDFFFFLISNVVLSHSVCKYLYKTKLHLYRSLQFYVWVLGSL